MMMKLNKRDIEDLSRGNRNSYTDNANKDELIECLADKLLELNDFCNYLISDVEEQIKKIKDNSSNLFDVSEKVGIENVDKTSEKISKATDELDDVVSVLEATIEHYNENICLE